VTRMITSNNYIATCAELICAFAAAIEADRTERDDAVDLANDAVVLAEECGWDWEADQDFARWALKATAEENLVEGLQKALAAVRAQYEAFLTRESVESRVRTIMAPFAQPWRWFCDGSWIVLEPPHGLIAAETMQHVRQHADVHTAEAVFRSTPSPGIYLRFHLRDHSVAQTLAPASTTAQKES
jgi:hypothetical protein